MNTPVTLTKPLQKELLKLNAQMYYSLALYHMLQAGKVIGVDSIMFVYHIEQYEHYNKLMNYIVEVINL